MRTETYVEYISFVVKRINIPCCLPNAEYVLCMRNLEQNQVVLELSNVTL